MTSNNFPAGELEKKWKEYFFFKNKNDFKIYGAIRLNGKTMEFTLNIFLAKCIFANKSGVFLHTSIFDIYSMSEMSSHSLYYQN